ncbi:PLP-dependent transferase [Karstenula rhodostoma CBS 690.94]|uniref:PLP-dependent transferase n=1 Tax=Karstenula rhodostoma CBS 690.94 TaxID=1392251 RepID=A0A9P4P5G2_9PLEO|nr:PLP-dependent transferase [Karstenula rhodostoma CBS 690.94]
MAASNFSEVVGSASSSKKLINLLRGHVSFPSLPPAPLLLLAALGPLWPNTSLLPTRLIEKGTRRVLQDPSIAFPALLYAPDNGDLKLRQNLASWLTDFYQPAAPISDERIAVTGGASQNLANLLQVFTDPVYTRNVWIVAPAYMLAFRIFDDSGLKLRAVPEDEQGIDIKYLRSEIRKTEDRAQAQSNSSEPIKPQRPWSKFYRHVIYAVPTFSNPSFKTMTRKRREQLVGLAREYDALIITDDVYDFLQWPSSLTAKDVSLDKAILPRIVDVDRYHDGGAEREGADGFGNSVSNGSFSKIAGPGLRTGWCEGTSKLVYGVSQTGSSRSGGAPSQIAATFLAEMLASGDLQRHVYEVLQPSYGRRYRKMVTVIEKELIPLGARLPQTDRDIVGGYFIWLTLPSGIESTAVVQRAKEEENVVVAQGEIFEVPGDTEHAGTHFENDIRMCFAWEDEDALAEGIERLARVIRTLQSEQQDRGAQSAQSATQHGTTVASAKDFW